MALVNALGVTDDHLGLPRRVLGHPRRHGRAARDRRRRLLHASARCRSSTCCRVSSSCSSSRSSSSATRRYIAFTNYGTGHTGTQEQAVEAALIQGERRVEGSPDLPARRSSSASASSASRSTTTATCGSAPTIEPLSEVPAPRSAAPAHRPRCPAGTSSTARELLSDQALQAAGRQTCGCRSPTTRTTGRSAPATERPAPSTCPRWCGTKRPRRSPTPRRARSTSRRRPRQLRRRGRHAAADRLVRHRRVRQLRDALHRSRPRRSRCCIVTVWTFVFAILSVVIPFGARAALRAHLQRPARCAAARFLRTLFILPYAFPAFMSALLFRGMFNAEFGVINDLFFFGAEHQLARRSVARPRRGPVGEPVAELPVLVPGVHRRAAGDPGRRRSRRRRSTAPAGSGSSGRSSCRCCSSRPRRC